MTYEEWIAQYVDRYATVLGKCAAATTEMCAAFPELKRVAGHVYPLGWGRRAHWWCVTPDGAIVDPTAAQFPGGDAFEYEPWEPGSPVRVGRCMNCGEDIMAYPEKLEEALGGASFCDDACAKDMAKAVGW